MALVGNGSLIHKSPGIFRSGTAAAMRSGWTKPGMTSNRFQSTNRLSNAFPEGHLSPSAWSLSRVSGGMSSRNEIFGDANLIANGSLGRNGNASLTGSGNITSALLALVVSAVANLSGSGALTGSIVGKLEAAAALAGSGNLAGAAGALASLLASLSGSGATTATPYASGSLSANIRGYSDLTPEGLRDAVWSALAVQFNTAGTMGALLNGGGGGGGLTLQQVRDAMALSTAAAIAAGSIDAKLDSIKVNTNLIPAAL